MRPPGQKRYRFALLLVSRCDICACEYLVPRIDNGGFGRAETRKVVKNTTKSGGHVDSSREKQKDRTLLSLNN